MVDTQMTFADRLKYLRKKRGLSLAALGVAAGVSAQAVHKWEKGGNLDAGRQLELASILNASPAWLLLGEGDAEETMTDVIRKPYPIPPSNFGPAAVPIMDSGFITKWLMGNGYNAPDYTEWIPCPCEHGQRAYALRITDDSMENLGEKISYSVGDIVFLDPDRKYTPGARVAMFDPAAENDFKVMIRQIKAVNGKVCVIALNPTLSHLTRELHDDDDHVSGVVIGKWTPE